MKILSDHPARRGRSLDPRATLLAAVVVILAVKSLHGAVELALAALSIALMVLALGVPWKSFLRHSLWVLPLCLAALPLMFTVPGPALTQVPLLGWSVSGPGVERFGVITAQCLLCLQVILLASSLSGPFALVETMGRLGCPARLVSVLRLCLRYMDLLAEELRRLQRARQSRGCREPGLAFRASVTGQLVGTLFLRSLGRAERVEMAMRSRGAGPVPLTGSDDRRWGFAETAVLGLAVALAGVSWIW